MKTHFILAALLLPLSLFAQGQKVIGPTLRMDRFYDTSAAVAENAAIARQYRVVNGVTNRLTDPGWSFLQGSVLQNVSGGMMVYAGSERIFLVHPPAVADDQPYSAWAKDTGEMYQYNTVGNSTKTIRKFDCGVPVPPPGQAAPPPARAMTPLEREAMAQRVVKYQLEQADKGLPSFQFLVGKRYMTGDGVERDPKIAREYFQKAAAQGDTDAQAALKEFVAK
jgi:hypothetical protein